MTTEQIEELKSRFAEHLQVKELDTRDGYAVEWTASQFQSPQSKDVEAKEAIEVLEFLLQQSADEKIVMADGDFYYEDDKDGDMPLSPEQIYKLFEGGKLSDNDKQKQ